MVHGGGQSRSSGSGANISSTQGSYSGGSIPASVGQSVSWGTTGTGGGTTSKGGGTSAVNIGVSSYVQGGTKSTTSEAYKAQALSRAIESSQKNFPNAWTQATGTSDPAKQRAIVTANQQRISQQTLTNGISTYHYDGTIASQVQTFLRPDPSPSLIAAITESQSKYPQAWATATGTNDPIQQQAKVTGGFTGAKVQITGVEGGEFTFLTEPDMPPNSIISQSEYNMLLQMYDKDTADELATQTYLTRQEYRETLPPEREGGAVMAAAQTVQTSIQEEQQIQANENRVKQTTRAPTPEPTPTYTPTTTPASSVVSILPFAIIAVVLVGVLLFLRRRA